ncbi:MAG: phage major capsid protein [Rhodospirillales bacterium]|nr:phage major capsid protein [Rhodospirillales bacterium]
MLLRPHELAERRAGKLDELRGILAAGDVNEEGRARFDGLKAEIEALDADLARAEFLAAAEKRSAGSHAQPDPLDHELAGYSVVRAIAAQIPDMAQRIDAGREREVSQELQRRSGRRHEGITVPLQALEKRVLTTAAPVGGPGGNLVPTDHRADLFIEPLRARLVVRRLGARVLSGLTGNVDIPRLTKSAVGHWVAENAAIAPSDPEFDKVSLAPKHCGGIVEMSRNMLQQTSPDVEQLVRSDLAAVLARAIDKAAIAGTGGTQPVGILGTVGVGTVTWAATWAKVLEFVAAIENADAAQGSLAWLTHPSVLPTLANTLKVTGDAGGGWLADAPDRMAGFPLLTSSLMPTDLGVGNDKTALVLGAWSELVLGYWSELDILVNPYETTAYSKGNVQVRAMATVDVAVRHPEAFAAAVDI